MKILSATLAACLTFEAFACDMSSARLFVPSLATALSSNVPTPAVKVLSVTRGTAGPGSSCDDAGSIELSVALPSHSTAEIRHFGVYFRILKGRLPDEIFPNVPVVGDVTGKEMKLRLAWLDDVPKRQKPLDLLVEAFLVSNRLQIGPSTAFEIKE